MAFEQTFEQLQSRVGGLVRVHYDGGSDSSLNGKIGLLMGAEAGFPAGGFGSMVVEVLIEEKIRSLLLYSRELEFLGSDDAG